MPVFVVHLSGDSEETSERLAEHYPKPGHYEIADDLFLVRANAIAETVAQEIGIKGDKRPDGAGGVVFKLNDAFAGYESRSLWEWLDLEDA